MPIITLTTDFGLRDPYAAQLKGTIMSMCPNANLVDISHNVGPYDLLEAAHMLNHSWKHFPVGTLHICTVDSNSETDTPFLCFRQNDHLFLMPDNGLVYLIFDDFNASVVRLEIPSGGSTKLSIAQAVKQISLGFEPTQLGEPAKDLVGSMRPAPVIQPDRIRASIVYIDRYHNAVLNVHRDQIDKMRKGRLVHTRFSQGDPIIGIHEHYHEVPQGDLLARYNSRGYVEICINMGRAAQLFGLERDQLIELEFIG